MAKAHDHDLELERMREALVEAEASVRGLSDAKLEAAVVSYHDDCIEAAAWALALVEETVRRQGLTAHERLEEERERLGLAAPDTPGTSASPPAQKGPSPLLPDRAPGQHRTSRCPPE